MVKGAWCLDPFTGIARMLLQVSRPQGWKILLQILALDCVHEFWKVTPPTLCQIWLELAKAVEMLIWQAPFPNLELREVPFNNSVSFLCSILLDWLFCASCLCNPISKNLRVISWERERERVSFIIIIIVITLPVYLTLSSTRIYGICLRNYLFFCLKF